MGKYRATINMPEGKRGQVVELNDADPRVLNLARDGFFIPVEVSQEVLKKIEEARSAPVQVAPNSVAAVKAVLEERRRAAGLIDSPTEGSEVQTAISGDEDEADEEVESDPAEVPAEDENTPAKDEPEETASRGSRKTRYSGS